MAGLERCTFKGSAGFLVLHSLFLSGCSCFASNGHPNTEIYMLAVGSVAGFVYVILAAYKVIYS